MPIYPYITLIISGIAKSIGRIGILRGFASPENPHWSLRDHEPCFLGCFFELRVPACGTNRKGLIRIVDFDQCSAVRAFVSAHPGFFTCVRHNDLHKKCGSADFYIIFNFKASCKKSPAQRQAPRDPGDVFHHPIGALNEFLSQKKTFADDCLFHILFPIRRDRTASVVEGDYIE